MVKGAGAEAIKAMVVEEQMASKEALLAGAVVDGELLGCTVLVAGRLQECASASVYLGKVTWWRK